MTLHRVCTALTLLLLGPAAALAQTEPPAAAPAAEAQRSLLPGGKLPELSDIRLPMPRAVRAANAVLGMARQRLALVVGNGNVGNDVALGAAARDTQAVAAALRAAGFVVMVREDQGADALRADLAEFRSRLQPAGVGFLYYTGFGAQLDGSNYLLPRGLPLEPAKAEAQLRAGGVPLQELVDAIQGTADSPRYMVLDAGYAHPALAGLAKPGLAPLKMPPGTMLLFANAPDTASTAPQAIALPAPLPAPADPRLLAASPFGRALARSLVTPRLSGAEVLRATRGAMLDISDGKQAPWIEGDNRDKDEFAEPALLEALLPRSPEEMAREALRQALRSPGTGTGTATASSAGAAGEVPVSEVTAPRLSKAPQPEAEGATKVIKRATESASGGATSATNATNAAGTAATATAATADLATGVAGTAASVATASTASQAIALATATAAAAVGAVGTLASLGTSAAATALDGAGPGKPPAGAATQAAAPTAPTAATAPPAPAAPAKPLAAPSAMPPPSAGDLPVEVFTAQQQAAQAARAAAAAAAQAAARAQAAEQQRSQPQPAGTDRLPALPRVNPFGYAEGDTFSYRTTDTWKNQIIGSSMLSIDQVLPDGRLVGDGARTQMDPQGRIQSTQYADGSRSQFQPYQDLWSANPKRGDSRAVRFNESFQRPDRRGQTEWKGSMSVGRPRTIQLPAGEFEVLPIESSGWFYEKLANGTLSSGQWSRTVWYSPKLGHPVAIDIEDANNMGRLVRRERIELTHAQTARAAQ